jgi:Mannosyltransferase (PIG-V)
MSVGLAPELQAEGRPHRFEIATAARPRSPLARGVPLSILAATALALLLRLYQLSRPNYLLGVSGYDDGVDFGSALRLVNGSLPYRDFALVQPPGITVLLAPVALLGKVVGSDSAFAVARVLTALAGASNVALVGLLVRHRGVVATTLACGLFAISPDAIIASHSVLLEPWLVLFCLVGLLLLFDGDRLTARSYRCLLGGAALGFACVIKVWAVLPVIVLVVCFLALADRRRTLAYVGGVIAAPAVFTLPFVAIAPTAFTRDVIFSQLARTDIARVPVVTRLISFTGIRDLNPRVGVTVAVAAALCAFIALCVVAATVISRRPPPPLEHFSIATSALVVAAFLWPPDYYPHYAAFLEPFLVCAIALPAASLGSALAISEPSFSLTPALDALRYLPSELASMRARLAPLIVTLRWPVLVFLSSRMVLVVMAAVEHHVRRQPFLAQFASWDGKWYGELALHWYPAHAGHGQTPLGFFPLYPVVVRRVAGVIAHFGTTLPFAEQINLAGVIVSGVGGLVATVLVQRLATAWWGVQAGRRAAVIFCLFPGSVVFSMVYAEGLLIPLAAGCILALQRRRWVLAGALAGMATATAPQGLVLILVCATAAARELHRRNRAKRSVRTSLWAPALSLTGVAAFASYLWLRTGTPFATLSAQHDAWKERTNPLALVDLLNAALAQITHPLPGKSTYKPVVAVIGALVLFMLLIFVYRNRRTMSMEALIWTAGISFLAVTTENVPPNPRMLITAFPAVVVLADRVRGRWFGWLASASLVLLIGASWLTFTVGHRMLPP